MHKVWSAIEDYRPARSLLTAIAVMAGLAVGPALAADPIKIGHVAAMSGGIDTPVAMAMVPILNREKMIHMGVWAAGTGITRNGANPNYIFRVSAVDVLVDVKLLDYANKKFGAKKAGLMLINNPW